MSPIDGTGAYRHNHESAKMHSEAAGKKYGEEKPESGGEHTEVHPHGDGTFHTVNKGEKVEHESIGALHAHLSKIHGEAGHKNFHVHHDGMVVKSHSVKAGEEPESREHEDVGGAHEHMDEAMGDEHAEPDADDEQPAMAGKGLGDLY